MNAREFYETVKEYARNEMFAEGEKSVHEPDPIKAQMHQAASHEAAKFYQMIEAMWIDSN